MSKVVLLGDTHFAYKSGSKLFGNHFSKFYDNILFPYIKENNIDTIIQSGDLFDERKGVNNSGLSYAREFFFDKLVENDITLYTLIGNHDIAYKDTLKVNSPSLLLNEYKNIIIIDKPSTINIKGKDVCFIPWICKENQDDCFAELNCSRSNICFGHFEIVGFAMYKGIIGHGGLESNVFDRFEYVFSGHYHHRSTKRNIHYIGTPYEMTFSDCGDPKGFHVFDVSTQELQFIKNPYKMYHKIFYDDSNEDVINKLIENSPNMDLKDTYIKLIVQNRNNLYLFDKLFECIEKEEPFDLNVIEEHHDVFNEELDDIDESEDTLTTMYKFVDMIENKDFDSIRIKKILNELYAEAVSIK